MKIRERGGLRMRYFILSCLGLILTGCAGSCLEYRLLDSYDAEKSYACNNALSSMMFYGGLGLNTSRPIDPPAFGEIPLQSVPPVWLRR